MKITEVSDPHFPLRVELDPNNIDAIAEWADGTKDKNVYEAMLNAALFLYHSKFDETPMIIFEADGNTLADIAFSKEHAHLALPNAEEYYAQNEEFEKAALARDLGTYFNNLHKSESNE